MICNSVVKKVWHDRRFSDFFGHIVWIKIIGEIYMKIIQLKINLYYVVQFIIVMNILNLIYTKSLTIH